MELFCVSAALPNNTPLKINGSPSFLQTKRFRNLPHRHNFNLSSITRGGVSPVSHSLSPPTLEHLKWGNHKADAEYLNHSSSAYRALPPRSPIPIALFPYLADLWFGQWPLFTTGSIRGRAERGRRTKRASVIIILGDGDGRLFC